MDVAVDLEIVARVMNEATGLLSRAKATPAAYTLERLCKESGAVARRFQVALMEAAIGSDRGYQGPTVPGHVDVGDGRHVLRYVAEKSRTVLTSAGPVTYSRAYYHSSVPKDSRWPRDEQLGILPQEKRSSELIELMAFAATVTGSYEQGVATLEKFTGLNTAYKQAQRTCVELGLELEKREVAEGKTILDVPKEADTERGPSPEAITVSVDGVNVDHCAGGTMELKVGRVQTASLQAPPKGRRVKTIKPRRRPRSQERAPSSERAQELADAKDTREQREYGAASGLVKEALRAVAPNRHLEPMYRQTAECGTYRASGRLESETFGQSLYLAARQLGVERCPLVVFLADGSKWCWNLCETHFADAVQILDVFHLAKHVVTTANALFGDRSRKAFNWRKEVMTMLVRGRWKRVVENLRSVSYTSAERREARQALIRYLEDNSVRIDYPTYIKRRLPISSAMIEGACRHVIGARMKGCGRRWDDDGAEAMAKLRAIHCSKGWDRHFVERRRLQLAALRQLRRAA